MYQYGEYFTKGEKNVNVQRDTCDAISIAALGVLKNTAS
jgi:hypothetical protein